jgi:hypothetical protein
MQIFYTANFSFLKQRMSSLEWIQKNHMIPAIGIYLILASLFWIWRPAVAFTDRGGIRPFGSGHPMSTLAPVWLWTFIFAIVAYLGMVFLRS